MQLPSGSRLGPYEIIAPIGSGGMGEVYRARDTRLGREVAVKVLPSHLSSNPQLRERFEREARAISSLTHPHICTLHDVGHHDGTDFLVMEYLEGETLADRLAKGPLPLKDVIRYGAEIAEALDKAHRQGIVHRDLKPGNIMITKSGAKVLDFGLAKYIAQDSSLITHQSSLLTERKPLTQEGTILGTIQYMAPEQLEGKEADARTDIFALGTILYEVATGKRAFEGKSKASLIASILTSEPRAIIEDQPLTPRSLERAIRKCLTKDPEDRWQTARDVASELRWIGEDQSSEAPMSAPARHGLSNLMPWGVAGLAIIAAGALAVMLWRRPAASEPEPIHFVVPPPENTALTPEVFLHNISVSPDGRQLAFIAARAGATPLLWVRPLGEATTRALPGTEGAASPFWSPDNRSIAFFAQGQLKRIALSGGPPQALCSAVFASGTWGRHDVILFAEAEGREGIYQISASGGVAQPVMKTAPRRPAWHFWPHFLPDGRRFLYLDNTAAGERSIHLGTVGSAQTKPVATINSRVEYAAPGYLVFARDSVLFAQRFDIDSLGLTGEAAVVAEQIPFFSTSGWADFSVSQNGVLAYQSGPILSRLTWFDRAGREIGPIEAAALYGSVRLSPDGKKVAFSRADARTGNDDLWIYDVSRKVSTRFTSDPGVEFNAIWNPTSDSITYAFDIGGSATIYQRPLSGTGRGDPLFPLTRFRVPHDWSSDGQYLLYSDTDEKTGFDLWILPMHGDRKPKPFHRTRFDETVGTFSPDGRWIAFMSTESGTAEVYVQRSDGTGEAWRISTAGGSLPRWRLNEIFYLAPDNTLMVVPAKTGERFTAGNAVALFATDALQFRFPLASYDVSADGQRVLVIRRLAGSVAAPIAVVVNWTAEFPK